MSHLEVGRVDSQLEGVQLAELQQAGGNVVDLGHSQSDSTHHLLSVGLHGARAGTQVWPVGEVGLGLRIDGEHPVEEKRWRKAVNMSEKPGQFRAQNKQMPAPEAQRHLWFSEKNLQCQWCYIQFWIFPLFQYQIRVSLSPPFFKVGINSLHYINRQFKKRSKRLNKWPNCRLEPRHSVSDRRDVRPFTCKTQSLKYVTKLHFISMSCHWSMRLTCQERQPQLHRLIWRFCPKAPWRSLCLCQLMLSCWLGSLYLNRVVNSSLFGGDST